MPKIKYQEIKLGQKSLDLIATCNQIIKEYTAAGYILTLRQLYYQCVSRDIIPNKQSEYKRVGSIVNDGRLAGLIDWSPPPPPPPSKTARAMSSPSPTGTRA